MSLETGTYVNDLVVGNPPGSDKKAQGDDHLRLIKTVLRNTFPQANKPLYFPRNASKTTGYSVVAGDDKTTFSVDTSGGQVNLTLPTLGPSDGGWSIEVLKVNGGPNPVFVFPASGTINGFSYVRRTLEFVSTRVLWNGSGWYATRPNGNMIGGIKVFCGPNLPNDCLWPNGGSFSAALYTELAGVLGTTVLPDLRDRAVIGRGNMGGADRGLITPANNFDATVLGGTGGNEGGKLVQSQLPDVKPTFAGDTPGSGTVDDLKIITRSDLGTPANNADVLSGVNVSFWWRVALGSGYTVTLPKPSGSISSINPNPQTVLSNLPPCMVLNFGVVAE